MTDNLPQPRVTLPGSERQPLVGSRTIGPVDSHERIEVSVYLRAPDDVDVAKELQAHITGQQEPRISRRSHTSPTNIISPW
jgi:hypothetical protein